MSRFVRAPTRSPMADTAAASSPPKSVKPPYHRRSYLIDRPFQLKYTLMLMAIGGGLSVLFGYMMYDAHVQTTQVLEIDAALKPLVQNADRRLVFFFLGIAGLMIASLGLVGVMMTHRVSGPIYVMSHYMAALAEGRYPRMRA